MNTQTQGKVKDFYVKAHKIAIGCLALHLVLCLTIAAFTQTWLLALLIGMPALALPAWLASQWPQATLSRLSVSFDVPAQGTCPAAWWSGTCRSQTCARAGGRQ